MSRKQKPFVVVLNEKHIQVTERYFEDFCFSLSVNLFRVEFCDDYCL